MPGFGAALRRAAAAERVVPRLISDRPEEWRLGPLTVAAGPRGAELRYARVAVGRAVPEPEAIMEGWRRALAGLVARSLAPEVLLPTLAESYAAILTREGRRAGDRVDLVAIRAEVTRRRPRHTRAQFAWDLARLRRERRLVHDGRRIDLGIATGQVAALRSRVVWIEDESGAGQYYLHFRMLEEGRR
jgi:hypothetical protein